MRLTPEQIRERFAAEVARFHSVNVSRDGGETYEHDMRKYAKGEWCRSGEAIAFAERLVAELVKGTEA